MRANLDSAGGLLMAESLATALAARIGRPEAQQLVKAVAGRVQAGGISFRQAALDDARISTALAPEAIDRALDPASYLGSADALIDRALAEYRALQEAL
jgi:3-carboxy-cis,cis-muconate cycloisomerase